jgi:hypothetical protein
LSAIGPNPLILKIKTPVQNIPIVAIAIRYSVLILILIFFLIFFLLIPVPNNPPIGFPWTSYIPEASPK